MQERISSKPDYSHKKRTSENISDVMGLQGAYLLVRPVCFVPPLHIMMRLRIPTLH